MSDVTFQPHCGVCGDPVGEPVTLPREMAGAITATCMRHIPPLAPLTPRQLARFIGEDYDPKPEYPCRVRIRGEGNDQEREVEVVYRGLRLVRLDTRQHGDLEMWWPHRIDLPEAGEGMPTTLMSEDFLPIVDVLSAVETIRQIDGAAEWYAEERNEKLRAAAVDRIAEMLDVPRALIGRPPVLAKQPPWPTPQGDEEEVRERRRLNDPATNPDWPVGAVINQYEVDRHAEKQEVPYNDAWRYFEAQGYEMSEVDPQS